MPIIYTKVLYHPSGMDGGLFVKKVPALRKLVAGEPLAEIDTGIPPAPEDLVIVKNYPSCFFGTSLASTLAGLSIDTLDHHRLLDERVRAGGCHRRYPVRLSCYRAARVRR